MICKYCRIVFGLFALAFSFFVSSSSVNATSTSSIYTFPSNLSTSTSVKFSDLTVSSGNLDTSTLDNSKSWFYTLNFIPISQYPNATINFKIDSTKTSFCNFSQSTPFYCTINISNDRPSTYNSRYSALTSNFQLDWSNLFQSVELIISDEDPNSSTPSGNLDISENGQYDVTDYSSVNVDVPPEVIQGDYHDDLVSIKIGIYTCAAVLLVLYFFYCIYRIIIKGGSL